MADYSSIVKKIVDLQPEGWSEVALYAQISKSSYEMFFYTKIAGTYYKNFELEKEFGLSREGIRSCFKIIFNDLTPDFTEKKWYVCTIRIKNTGDFAVDYEYTDYSGESLKYKNIWKEKYLI